MKLALIVAAVVPLIFAAQTPAPGGLTAAITKYPKCAAPCVLGSLNVTKCDITDTPCLCADQHLMQVVTGCVLEKCTIVEALTTQNITNTACGAPIRDRGKKYTVISNIMGPLSGAFVIQRIAYKIWAGLDFGWDDWFCLITIVSGIPATIFNAHQLVDNGMGRDVWTLQPNQITQFGLCFYIIEVMYFLEVATLKLSLLFFYIRIFPTRGVRRLLWGTVAFVSVFGLAYIFLGIFQCTPISHFWTKWDGTHTGHCININILGWSNAAISIATDIWMLVVPLWQLRSLQLDWRRKIGVGMMFVVGTFVTVISVLRLRSLVTFGADSLNPTWEFFDVSMWSNIEINVGIICICMPALRLLLVRLFPKILGTTQRYYAKYSNSGNKSANDREQRSGRFGNVSVSRAERGDFTGQQHELGQISYQKTYTVKYGDADGAELVSGASEIDMRSAKSLTSISARESSEKRTRSP